MKGLEAVDGVAFCLVSLGSDFLNNTCGLVLAAGAGKRMFSQKPKVLLEVLFKPMLFWVLDSVIASGISDTCVVAGYMHEFLEIALKSAGYSSEIALQDKQLGTAHAVLSAKNFLLRNIDKDIFIVGGDSPFVGEKVIREAYKVHKLHGNCATVISSSVKEPYGYGRIIREPSEDGAKISAIVEERDAGSEQKKICEINSGAYWFSVKHLLEVIDMVSNCTAQNEYYLTSVIELLIKNGLRVEAHVTPDVSVVMGANDSRQLANLNEYARQKVLDDLVSKGVFISCRDGVIISSNVEIYSGTTILPSTIIKGNSKIGYQCTIGPGSFISDCKIGDCVSIVSSYCQNSTISDNKLIGPFERIKNFHYHSVPRSEVSTVFV